MVDLVLKTPFDQQLMQLFAKVDVQNSVILTPNQRLSRFFIERYSSMQTNKAFKSLPCLAINNWINQIWSDLEFIDNHPLANSTILTHFQENLLWEKLLTEHPETPPLINIRATARQAQDAWRLLHEWRLNDEELIQAANAINDPFIFNAWRYEFEQICKQNQYLSAVELPYLVATRIEIQKEISTLKLPEHVYLYGFDELTPVIKHFLNCLENIGPKVTPLDLQVKNHSAKRIEFVNEQEELVAAASWAKQKIAEQPDVTIAVVVPDLTTQRSRVERIFMQEFEPQYIFADRSQHATGFNISAGQALSQVPIISAGLAALGCHAERTNIFQFSILLRSPFIGTHKELSTRALLDLTLHDLGELELSFQQFKTLISENIIKAPSIEDDEFLSIEEKLEDSLPLPKNFHQHLSQYDLLRKQTKNSEHYPSKWCGIFIEALTAWGWPGDRQLDTLEYQQIQSWHQTLEEYAGLDYLLGKINYSKALDVLTLALQQTAFHAQTLNSPLQILGLLEAAGLPFDYLWIIGLDDDTWPPTAKPNPLLPLSLQRKLNLPQSSPEREFHFAANLMQRLTQSSVNLFTSSVCIKGDKKISSSPLVSLFPTIDFTINESFQFEKDLFTSPQIESYSDSNGPSVIKLESIRGGSQILKSQATCPFQAFALYRLHASEIPTPIIGLSLQERGKLLHKAMEIIWRNLSSHAQLMKLENEDLLNLVNQSISTALRDIRQKPVAGQRFLELEKQRLAIQVLEWLQLEKERHPFKVLFNESRKTINLHNMPIHIRFDRVDQLEDGSLFVLDYKTGNALVKDWGGDRPNEPQVPLYAIANKDSVKGAAFGVISENKIMFSGIAEDNEIAPGLTEIEKLKWDLTNAMPMTWNNILHHWEHVLSQLAGEFLQGLAKVDPKNPNISCRYCQLHTMCRIRDQIDFDLVIDAEESSGDFSDAE